MRKIYIAGPDVFAPNAYEIGEKYKQICAKYGFEGLYPLDGSGGEDLTAREIFVANQDRIKLADIVIANLNPFRGYCMDDGTAWEIGYACGLRKAVYGYVSDMRSLRERIGDHDLDGFAVENFNYPVNLMIMESITAIVQGGFEDCFCWLVGTG